MFLLCVFMMCLWLCFLWCCVFLVMFFFFCFCCVVLFFFFFFFCCGNLRHLPWFTTLRFSALTPSEFCLLFCLYSCFYSILSLCRLSLLSYLLFCLLIHYHCLVASFIYMFLCVYASTYIYTFSLHFALPICYVVV